MKSQKSKIHFGHSNLGVHWTQKKEGERAQNKQIMLTKAKIEIYFYVI